MRVRSQLRKVRKGLLLIVDSPRLSCMMIMPESMMLRRPLEIWMSFPYARNSVRGPTEHTHISNVLDLSGSCVLRCGRSDGVSTRLRARQTSLTNDRFCPDTALCNAVVFTIGPACQDVDTLCRILDAGATCARCDLTVEKYSLQHAVQ